jgi:hypothetical protein
MALLLKFLNPSRALLSVLRVQVALPSAKPIRRWRAQPPTFFFRFLWRKEPLTATSAAW